MGAPLDRSARLDPFRREQLEQHPEHVPRLSVDEEEVEAVADPEPVEARVGYREGALARGGAMDVQDGAALFGVPTSAPCSAARRVSVAIVSPLPRRITSGILRGSDTEILAPSRSGERTRPTAPGGSQRLQRRPEHVVDENSDSPKRGASGPEDRSVAALEELSGDVESDVGTSLEVRPDGADRNSTLTHLEPVGKRP